MSLMLPDPSAPPGGGVPPELAALLGGAAGPAPPDALQPQAPPPPDPLEELQATINQLVSAMHALTDPQDVEDVSKALTLLARVQTRRMGGSGPQAR